MKNRNLTVDKYIPSRRTHKFYYSNRQNYASRLRIQGNWLREAGFNPGDKVKVEVDQGKLTIVNLSTEDMAERTPVEYCYAR
jgi:formylmethanofuran dehydrogenase subunit D